MCSIRFATCLQSLSWQRITLQRYNPQPRSTLQLLSVHCGLSVALLLHHALRAWPNDTPQQNAFVGIRSWRFFSTATLECKCEFHEISAAQCHAQLFSPTSSYHGNLVTFCTAKMLLSKQTCCTRKDGRESERFRLKIKLAFPVHARPRRNNHEAGIQMFVHLNWWTRRC